MSKGKRQERKDKRQPDEAASQDALLSQAAASGPAPKTNEEFEAALKEQRVDAFREMKGNIKDRTSLYVRRGHDRGRAYEESLKALYLGKVDIISSAFREMREKQSGQMESINERYLIEKHKIVLNALSHRFDLILDIAGNSKISTDKEAVEFAEYGYKILQDIDVYGLIFDKDTRGDKFMQAYVLNVAGEKPQDKIELIERIDMARRQGKPIEDADLRMIADIILDKSGKTKDTMVSLLLSYLDMSQRMQLIEQMMEKNTKGMPGLIKYLTQIGYLKKGQAVALAESKKDQPEYQQLLVYLGSDQLRRLHKRVASAQKKNSEIMRRTHGHKNYAKDLFSLKGIASGLLFVNGTMTVGLNILANLKNPADIPGNPAIWLGAGMAGIGAQWSGGFGGLMPTPEKLVARATRGTEEKDEAATEKQKGVSDKMRDSIAWDYEISEFYYKNADKIREVYDRKKKTATPKTRITLKDLGFEGEAYEQLPEDLKRLSKKHVNDTITDWMFTFMRVKDGLAAQSADKQRMFINETRMAQGLPKFEKA